MSNIIDRFLAEMVTMADNYDQRLDDLEANRESVQNNHRVLLMVCIEELKSLKGDRSNSK